MRRPVIFVNPLSDGQFVAYVDACLPRAVDPGTLQELLRARYPRAVVRPRLLEGEPVAIWYAYRDGSWVRSEFEGRA